MATDKTQGLPHMWLPLLAEIAAAAIAPYVQKAFGFFDVRVMLVKLS